MEKYIKMLETLVNDYKKTKPNFTEYTEIIVSNVVYTDIIEAIEKIIKRYKELEKEKLSKSGIYKFEIKTGGRTNGQTLENGLTFLKYIDELEPNKMYGIINCGRGITLLTKQEVVVKSKIKRTIEEIMQTYYPDEAILKIIEELD